MSEPIRKELDSRVLCFSCPVRDYVASARATLAIAGESVE